MFRESAILYEGTHVRTKYVNCCVNAAPSSMFSPSCAIQGAHFRSLKRRFLSTTKTCAVLLLRSRCDAEVIS